LQLFYWMRLVGGVVTAIGAVLFIASIVLPPREEAATRASLAPAE
jgi:nitric oxide reductase large subunit